MYLEKISIAPMLDWTDRHYRYFMRKLTQHTVLYSEMVVADAIIHGDRDKLLGFENSEQPVVLQLGGCSPGKLATAAQIAKTYGYREFNLNCGCPSDKVQSGKFGASLMKDPRLVSDCLSAIYDVTGLSVSLKHRIGLDNEQNYAFVANFIATVAELSPCRKFIVHARNAVLSGLNPKQNREIPPLKYAYVHQLKRDFPHLFIVINGGVTTLEQINLHLQYVDGVMLGREAYRNPYLFTSIEQELFKCASITQPSRNQVARAMQPYLAQLLANNQRLHYATRHMMGLYHATKDARIWRSTLSNKLIHSNSLEDYLSLIKHMAL